MLELICEEKDYFGSGGGIGVDRGFGIFVGSVSN
jgi:hypothetical protein